MLHMDFENLRLQKSVIEIKHKEVFSLPENKFKILEKLNEKFPNYDINKSDRLLLFNAEERKQINIELNRLIIDWDEPTSFNSFIKFSQSIFNEINKFLKVDTAFRIGLRSFWVLRTQNQQEAFDYIFNRYFSPNSRNNSTLITDEILNPSIRFSGRKGNFKFNLGISYQEHHFVEGIRNKIITEKVDDSILLDVDNYRENYNLKQISSFFSEVDEFVMNKLIQYLRSVEG